MQAEKRRLLQELAARYPRPGKDPSLLKENATLDDVHTGLARLTDLQEVEIAGQEGRVPSNLALRHPSRLQIHNNSIVSHSSAPVATDHELSPHLVAGLAARQRIPHISRDCYFNRFTRAIFNSDRLRA